jgi:drug/metabolite transporter (DMT)-like permease
VFYAIALFGAVLTSLGHVCIKKLALRTLAGGSMFSRWRDPYLAAGGILFAVSAASGVVALKGLDFSVFYCLTAVTYLFIVFLGRICLIERIDRAKIVGSLMVIAGILVYNLC